MTAVSDSSPLIQGQSPERPSAVRIWLQAIRPATLPASAVPVIVGCAAAQSDGVFSWLPAVMALVGALLIQIGTNLANDYFDFKKGADTSERVGPARVTQKGWLTPQQVARAAVLVFATTIVSGIYLAAVGGWPIVVIGLVSVACGVLYTGGPKPLGYLGLGDLFVFIFFGPVAVCGTYYVQSLSVSTTAMLVSLPIGYLTTAILVVNNLRDRQTDAVANKRTLAVRFGAGFVRMEYLALILLAYMVPVVAYLLGLGHLMWLLPLVTLPTAARRVRSVWRLDGAALNPELGATARLTLLYGFALSMGLL